MGSRYICPFSYCSHGCWTAWGIKRHVKAHMDRLHASMDAHQAQDPTTDRHDKQEG